MKVVSRYQMRVSENGDGRRTWGETFVSVAEAEKFVYKEECGEGGEDFGDGNVEIVHDLQTMNLKILGR